MNPRLLPPDDAPAQNDLASLRLLSQSSARQPVEDRDLVIATAART